MEKNCITEKIEIEIIKLTALDKGFYNEDEECNPYYEKETCGVTIKFEDHILGLDQNTANMLTRMIDLIRNEKRN